MIQQIIPMQGVPRGTIVNLDACQDDDAPVDDSFFGEQLDVLMSRYPDADFEELVEAINQRRVRLSNDDAHWQIMTGLLATAMIRLRGT